jgi:hypothetical protein
MENTALRPGDPAPDVPVVDAAGEHFQLAALWRDRPLVLGFLRHYG